MSYLKDNFYNKKYTEQLSCNLRMKFAWGRMKIILFMVFMFKH